MTEEMMVRVQVGDSIPGVGRVVTLPWGGTVLVQEDALKSLSRPQTAETGRLTFADEPMHYLADVVRREIVAFFQREIPLTERGHFTLLSQIYQRLAPDTPLPSWLSAGVAGEPVPKM